MLLYIYISVTHLDPPTRPQHPPPIHYYTLSDQAVRVQYTNSDTGQLEGTPVELATKADLDAVLARVYELEASVLTKEKADVNYVMSKDATTFAKAAEVNVLEIQLTETLSAFATLSEQNAKVVKCGDLNDPKDGSVQVPEEHIPGTLAKYSCDDFYYLNGSDVSTCLSSGTWSGTAPTCKHVNEGSQQNPGQSCKAIYWALSQQQGGSQIEDGTYWIKPTDTDRPFQVFCDMTTKTKEGYSGWTLCGKYDRERRGSKYLAQGFGRAPSGAGSMSSLYDFTDAAAGQRWASIDCRNILQSAGGYGNGFGKGSGWAIEASKGKVDPGAFWFMHAASNGVGAGYEVAQFTNVMDDVRKDATKFFDTASDDTGICVSNDVGTTETGGITTYSSDWTVYTDNRDLNKKDHDVQSCLYGDGHHFCSFGRDGMQFNNAQGYKEDPDTVGIGKNNSACTGSLRDTIFWGWNEVIKRVVMYLSTGTQAVRVGFRV